MFTNLTPVIQSSSKRCSHRKVHHHLRTMQHHPVPRGEHHLALPLSSGHSTLVLLLKPVCHLLLIGQPPGTGWGKCLSRESPYLPSAALRWNQEDLLTSWSAPAQYTGRITLLPRCTSHLKKGKSEFLSRRIYKPSPFYCHGTCSSPLKSGLYSSGVLHTEWFPHLNG